MHADVDALRHGFRRIAAVESSLKRPVEMKRADLLAGPLPSSADANLSPLIVEAHYMVLEEIPAEYSIEVLWQLEW